MQTKHHHITRTQSNWVVRYMEKGELTRRYFPSLEEALAARDAVLPPSLYKPITKAEHARQVKTLPRGTSLIGVYVHGTKSGYIVRLNRGTGIHYGGFFRGETALAEAVAARDALQDACPIAGKAGRPRKTQQV